MGDAILDKYGDEGAHWERFRQFVCPDVPSIEALASKDIFDSALPKATCLEMILMVHLLFEEVMNGILTDALAIDELPPPGAGALSFYQKLSLVRMIAEQSPNPPKNQTVFKTVEVLNTVRNKLSHKLHEELNLAQIYDDVIRKYEKEHPLESTLLQVSNREHRMLRAFWYSYFALTLQRLILRERRNSGH